MPVSIATITGISKNYLEIFFRRKMLVFLPVVLCTSLAIMFSFTIPPKYRTSTIVLVEEEKVSNPLLEGLAISSTVKDRLETIVKILLSRPLLEQVVSELNLDYGVEMSPLSRDDLLDSLRESISVSLIGRDILKVTAESRDPETCQKVANAITTLFIKHNLDLQTKETNIGIDFLKSQKEIYEAKLRDSEKALRKFREKNQEFLSQKGSDELKEAMGNAAQGNIELLRYSEYKGDLIQLNLQLNQLLKRREKILKQLNGEDQYVIAERMLDPVVRELEQELAKKQVELAKLEIDATERHPLVVRLRKDIEELQKTIRNKRTLTFDAQGKETVNPVYQNLRVSLNGLDQEVESIRTRIKLTEIYLEQKSDEIRNIPQRQEELANLQRDYQINAGIYQGLSTKLETAYITKRLELQEKGTKFRVVEPATVPLRPFKPNRKFMGMAGFALGLFVGFGFLFLAEMTDHSFTEINQLRNFLHIPVLASISQILTFEEAEEAKAKKRLFILCTVFFVLFLILGGIAKYIVSKM